MPGNNGVPGSPGTPGRDGRDGRDSGKGEKGEVGTRGPAGDKGDKGDTSVPVNAARNWKQCVWKAKDDKDIGLIKVSIFRFPFTGEKGMSVHAFIFYSLSVCRLICSFVYLVICVLVIPSVFLSVRLCSCSFVYLFVCSLVRLYT